MFLDWLTIQYSRFRTSPIINLYPTIASVVCKNGNRKLNNISSYAMKMFGIEYRGFLLRFCMHRNEFNCIFGSKQLRQYAIRSLIWGYDIVTIRPSVDESLFTS